MSSSMPNGLHFENTVIIDWYDGDVTALVKKRPSGTWLLASLLSYDISTRERIYALLPIASQMAEDIRRRIEACDESNTGKEKLWSYLARVIRQIGDSAKGEIEIVQCKSLLDKSLTTWISEAGDPEIRRRIGQGIEGAIEASDKGLLFGSPAGAG